MSRLLAVARLHTIPWPALTWPWLILAISFVANLAIFSAITVDEPEKPPTGGLMSIFVVTIVLFAGAVTQVFPYALGMGVTRRMFYAATALFAVLLSAVFALGLYVMLLFEIATGGWWMGLRFFGVRFTTVEGGNPAQILIYFVVLLLMAAVGIFIGVVYVRWRGLGVLTLTAVSIVVQGGLAALVTWRGWWGDIGAWLADQPVLALLAGWPLVLLAAAGIAGLLAIRRATA